MRNITGIKFNRLLVVSQINDNIKFVLCKCDCGTTKVLHKNAVTSGNTKSCGCLKKETKSNLKHGLVYHSLYSVWYGMKNRCYNKNVLQYKDYGGRGITICDEWLNDFKTFYDWAINNGWQKGLFIDRQNNNGNYEPTNCRIISRKLNNRNARSNVLNPMRVRICKKLHTLGFKYSHIASLYKTTGAVIRNAVLGHSWSE